VAGYRSFYPEGGLRGGDLAVLDDAESRHLVKALRARVGDAVTLFDGEGHAWQGQLERTGRKAEVRIEAECNVTPPPKPFYLAIALLKGKGLDAVIRVAVALGASGIYPLETERTEVRLDDDRAESKREHWRMIAIEAAKQCGNLNRFDIAAPQTLTAFLGEAPQGAAKLVASLQPGAAPLLSALRTPGAATMALIGPEGDFSPAEYDHIARAGFEPVSLGAYVLRSEAAAGHFLSVMQAVTALGD